MQDKDKIELTYKSDRVLGRYTTIKINGIPLKNITFSDMEFYANVFGPRSMRLQLNIPLDKYEITINQEIEEIEEEIKK